MKAFKQKLKTPRSFLTQKSKTVEWHFCLHVNSVTVSQRNSFFSPTISTSSWASMMPSLWISVITFHMIALFFNFKVLLKDSNEIASDKSCHVLESPASFRDCQGKWSLIKCLGSVKKKSLIFLWIFFYPGNQQPKWTRWNAEHHTHAQRTTHDLCWCLAVKGVFLV